jgi:hypothetical protein
MINCKFKANNLFSGGISRPAWNIVEANESTTRCEDNISQNE